MKGAAAAALHALAEVARVGGAQAEIVLVAVASEEDGGLGAFAALERDAAFDACLIPEPTGFDVVCAQAGALTFEGVVPGVAAHAAHRLEGVSAIDRYLPVHRALAEHERALNADVEHPLMRALELPYPLLVGRLEAGEWSSSVPDRLRFEGRAPVRVGEDVEAARAGVEAVVAAACPQARLSWPGGQFASGQTDPEHPFALLVRGALGAELDREVARRRGAVGRRHAPVDRARDPDRDGRHAGHRARPRRRRARPHRRPRHAGSRDRACGHGVQRGAGGLSAFPSQPAASARPWRCPAASAAANGSVAMKSVPIAAAASASGPTWCTRAPRRRRICSSTEMATRKAWRRGELSEAVGSRHSTSV